MKRQVRACILSFFLGLLVLTPIHAGMAQPAWAANADDPADDSITIVSVTPRIFLRGAM